MVKSRKLEEIMTLIATNPTKAANELDKMADELKGVAARLRLNKRKKNPTLHVGGLGDRVSARLVGPDGEIKQSFETGG